MAAWPTLADVRTFLRMKAGDTNDDEMITDALAAAIDYVCRGLGSWYTPDTAVIPDGVAYATMMFAGRLYRRRDTIDGTVWGGDGGAIRVPRVDPDTDNLLARYEPVVFG